MSTATDQRPHGMRRHAPATATTAGWGETPLWTCINPAEASCFKSCGVGRRGLEPRTSALRRCDPCALNGAPRIGVRSFIKCRQMALSGAIDSSGARLTLVTWNGEGILGAPSAARAETRSRSWSQGPEFSSVTNACSSAMKSSTRPGRLTPERARRAQGFVRERHQARDAPGHLGGFVGSGSKRPKRTCASSQWWAVPTVTRTTFR